MNTFFKIPAWLFHPLLMPLLGVICYFWITPRYHVPELVYSKLVVVLILTFLIPILLYFLLKTLGFVTSIHLNEVKERKLPLMFQCVILVILIKSVFQQTQYPELYFFFVATLCSCIAAFILVAFQFKVSLHLMGLAGVAMFVTALSIHFHINALFLIGWLVFCLGWLASSRLFTKSHSFIELIIGFFIGLIPQLVSLNYWL